jgi:hypothetical protein
MPVFGRRPRAEAKEGPADRCRAPALPDGRVAPGGAFPESNMGKYVLGWFLGVPVILLVVLYMIFH